MWSILQIILTNTYFCVRFWTVLPDMQTKVNKIEWPNFQIQITNCICSNNGLVQAIWFFWGNRRRLYTQTLFWKISVSWQLWLVKYCIELNWRGFIVIVKIDRIVYLVKRWNGFNGSLRSILPFLDCGCLFLLLHSSYLGPLQPFLLLHLDQLGILYGLPTPNSFKT